MMQNVLDRLTSQFEGQQITTIVYRGRPCWIAREVGKVLDYAQEGKMLINCITQEWSEEFELNEHHAILKGQELVEFKQLLKGGWENHPPFNTKQAKSLMLIYEPGLHLVFTKTHKPVGVRLRKFLTSEVLPQIVRDGFYSPNRAVVNGRLTSEDRALELRKLTLEEEKIKIENEKIKIENKRMKSEALKELVTILEQRGGFSQDIIFFYELTSIEEASGYNLADLKPYIAENWIAPAEIADRLQVSPQFIGKIITKLNLKNDPNHSMAIINKDKHSDETVISYVYDSEAVSRIEVSARKKIKKLTQ